jgi:hypothetical protein
MQTTVVARLIDEGLESRSVEFKSAGAWTDTALQAAIKKACLALGNTRDGGTLIVGAKPKADASGVHELDPLSEDQLRSFDPDQVIPQINAHASPHLTISVERHEVKPGQFVVALAVAELRDTPFLCVRDIIGQNNRVIVPRGRILIRSRRAHESTDLQYGEDLRELTDLIVDKGLETYFRRRAIESESSRPNDADLFRQQLGGL